jgi:uncharacterized protein YpuA (DUF1002 family)
MQAVLNEVTESKKIDIEYAVVKISAQLSWVADAIENSGNEPGADVVLRGIVDQLNALINPIAQMQREVRS